jgi:hypothetical protein
MQKSQAWPLTSMQMSMVFQTLHGRSRECYVQQLVCRSNAVTSTETVGEALSILSNKHVALRLQVDWGSGAPVQTVGEVSEVHVETGRWQGFEAWKEFLRVDRDREFDLSRAPLFRATVFSDGPDNTLLVFRYHHMLLDGRSRRIVMGELFKLFDAKHPSEDLLPARPVPYTAYLDWLSGNDFATSGKFRSEYLQGVAAAADLPLPAPFAGSPAAGSRHSAISELLTMRLRGLARTCGCTLNNLIQASWAVVLSRYTGTDEVVFGTIRACRHSAMNGSGAGVVGLLINNIPMRVRMPRGTTLAAILRNLKRMQVQLRDHENTPMPDILLASGLRAEEALCGTYLTFDETGEEFPGWRSELHEQTDTLSMSARGGTGIDLTLEYDTGRYRDGPMERLPADFRAILAEMTGNQDVEISAIQPCCLSLSIHPREGELRFGNAIEAIDFWSQLDPNRAAVVFNGGALSYADLDRRSNQVAHELIALGIGPESLVGLAIERSADLIVAFLGIWKAGAAYVPIDRRYPEKRQAWIREDSRIVTVLVELPEHRHRPETSPGLRPLPDAPAYVINTSGSTGKPKRVLISHVGAPMVTAEDHVLGPLCLLDKRPGDYWAGERVADLAQLAVDRLELRRTAPRLTARCSSIHE